MIFPFKDVMRFHRKFGAYIGATPSLPPREVIELRVSLIREEIAELLNAIELGDVPGIADAGVDSIYVLIGLLIAFGIDPGPVWDAVQSANMAKEGGAKREDGKILKPPDWKHPDIRSILMKQEPLTV